ncbi:hypothetical protein LV779_28115 [Streptomyces thinghirensis]|nr:hypothetical protein [Streptomyces thinghirensis]
MGEDRPVHHVRRERRLLRPPGAAVPPKSAAGGPLHRGRLPRRLQGSKTHREGLNGLGPRVPMLVALTLSRAASSAPRPSTTPPPSSGSWNAACRASRQATGRGGAAVCGDPTAAFDFSRGDSRPGRARRTPTPTSRRTANATSGLPLDAARRPGHYVLGRNAVQPGPACCACPATVDGAVDAAAGKVHR